MCVLPLSTVFVCKVVSSRREVTVSNYNRIYRARTMKSHSELNKYKFNSLKGVLSFKVNLSWPSLFLYAKRAPTVSCLSRSPSTRKSWIEMQPTVLNLLLRCPTCFLEQTGKAEGAICWLGGKEMWMSRVYLPPGSWVPILKWLGMLGMSEQGIECRERIN